jgi:hypothetical protein
VRLMKTNAVLAAAVVCCACAGSKSAERSEPNAPAVETKSFKVQNLIPFDIALCSAPTLEVPKPATKESLLGALLAGRPALLECLVDPASRGPALESGATITATLASSGPSFAIDGTNLTEAGKACLQKAAGRVELGALAEGATPVSTTFTVQHGPQSGAVRFGLNAASDIAGRVRLAMPKWCNCYSAFGSANAPPTLSAKMTLYKDGKPTQVVFSAAPGLEAATTCLTEKLQGPLGPLQDEVTGLTLPFLLVNSNAVGEQAANAAELQFIQLDGVRAQRSAQTAVRIGVREATNAAYNRLVSEYKAAKPKLQPALLKELRVRCDSLVKADDAWVAAMKAQLEIDSRTSNVVSAFAQKDAAAWGPAVAATKAQLDGTSADLAKVQAIRVSDAGVCPT